MSKKEQKVKLKINTDNFSTFIEKLSIVSSINDTVMIKIDSNDILIYSMISGGSMILAFKNFILKTSDIFTNEIDYKMNLIIPNCKKFVKNLAFIRELDKIDFELSCREEDDDFLSVRSFKLSSGKFKVTWMGGDSSSIRDINKTNLDRLLDLNNKKWSFNIDNSDFLDIKKLSSINGERIINMDAIEGNIVISERSAWELEVDKTDEVKSASLIFNKRFFSCINDKVEKITFNIFDNFMLVTEKDSNLMLSFEQSFDDDDDY